MTDEIKTFNGTGADCSGSTGATDRVLTLETIKNFINIT